MRRYLSIYKALFGIGINRVIAYRFDTWVGSFVTTGIWTFLTIFSMYALTRRTDGLFGWTAQELVMLSCLYNVFIGLISFLFARNFEDFSELVNKGTLDSLLLKPIDSQFMVSLNKVHITALIRTIVGAIVAVIFIRQLGIDITATSSLLFGILSLFGILLMYSVLFTILTTTIWFTRLDNLNQLFYLLRSLGRYPRGTFLQAGELVGVLVSPFIVPLATPARALIGKATPYEILELILGSMIFFLVCRLFWKTALRNYTSASG